MFKVDKQSIIFWDLMEHKDVLTAWFWKDIPLRYRILIKLKIYHTCICGDASDENGINIWLGVFNDWNNRKFEKWKVYSKGNEG